MPRSGGFATVDVGEMHEASWLITDALMFVGGGSASTAGGIKVTTLAVHDPGDRRRGARRPGRGGLRPPHPSDTVRLAVAVVFIGATHRAGLHLVLLEVTGEPSTSCSSR